jgi:hypothetical protein
MGGAKGVKREELREALSKANIGELLIDRFVDQLLGASCQAGCEEGCNQCCESGTANRFATPISFPSSQGP